MTENIQNVSSERQIVWGVGNELGVGVGLGEDELPGKQSDMGLWIPY